MKILRGLPLLTLLVLFTFSINPATSGASGSNAGPSAGGSRAIMFDLSPGIAAPPATLGGFPMTPVPSPGAPACTGLLAPLPTPGGPLGVAPSDTFSRCIGAGWGTWSHGYVGDVYYTGGAPSQTLTLPPGTVAFYFYVEPNPFAIHDFEVFADGVSSGLFTADGSSGATYVGAYDDAGGSISSITVRSISGVDFATGEYGISFKQQQCPCRVDVSGAYSTAGTLSLNFTLSSPGPATWANFLVVVSPAVTVIPLWSVPVPTLCPPFSLPISFALPQIGIVGIYSGLFDATGAFCYDLEWFDTGP